MMRVKQEIVNARRDKIMIHIQEYGEATVIELADLFGVSSVTIRRDLQYWEDKFALEKVYGGARIVQKIIDAPKLSIQDHRQHAIAKYAARLVNNNDTIFINSSTTALLMLLYIKDKSITVITNNGRAIHLDCDPGITIILTGGEVHFPKVAMVGNFALSSLDLVKADKAFLGCSGFHTEQGITTAISEEVQINKKMIGRCPNHVYLLADSSKVQKVYSFKSADMTCINTLITDSDVDDSVIDTLSDFGIKSIQLDPIMIEKQQKG